MHPLKVSLEDLYSGITKKLSLSRNVICSKCSGSVFVVCYSLAFILYARIVFRTKSSVWYVSCVIKDGEPEVTGLIHENNLL